MTKMCRFSAYSCTFMERTFVKRVFPATLLMVLLSLAGCSTVPHIVAPPPPIKPMSGDLMVLERYKSDVAAYTAAVEGGAEPACPQTGAAGTAAALSFCTQSSGTAGSSLPGVVVQIHDANGGLVN